MKAGTTDTATGAGPTVQDSIGTGTVKKDEEKYLIEKLNRYFRTETVMQHRARWYGYNPSKDA